MNVKAETRRIIRLLMDGRVFQKAKADVHHQAGMECIDCHVVDGNNG
ncbi:MAG: hypothetical protein MZV64_07930 [Ignavibacteriales bacterium]|nr:hypothetical protein [Ignavibacteriales bacterium]